MRVPRIAVFFVTFLSTALAGPIVVTPSTDAAALVAALVGGNPGITVVGGSQILAGGPAASGFFTGGTGVLPFDGGIVLTTGEAGFVTGPNDTGSYSVDNLAPGFAPLTAIVGESTFNAAVLSFSFIPVSNAISFQYAFGSEEYNEFVGTPFNDVFAFLLNGTNIALIPGSSVPVSINTVNNGINSGFYFDNTSALRDTQLDGLVGASFSPAFWLFATGPVNPGVPNTIQIAIADTSDGIYDSAVFLKAGSFMNASPIQPDSPAQVIPEPSSYALLAGGLALIFWRKRRAA